MTDSGSGSEDWRPSAAWPVLRRRAEVLARVRSFFADRGVLEVETPHLAAATATDLHLASIPARVETSGGPATRWLQTSPELHMKRLLAAGAGPIYQLGRAFRDGEAGPRHNPEFTLLEWYRPGWDHHRLMDEVDALLMAVLGTAAGERWSYRQVFRRHLGIDPHGSDAGTLAERARQAGLDAVPGLDRDGWLDYLLATVVEPQLGRERPTFVHSFPASQAALARTEVDAEGSEVAARFEVFVHGVELANGFHELTDAAEQRRRFAADLARRRRRGLPEPPADERFLAALENGLPDCAGVALGVDRLVMLAVGADHIDQVLAFPARRA